MGRRLGRDNRNLAVRCRPDRGRTSITSRRPRCSALTEDNDPNDLIGRPNGRECLKTNLQRAFASGPSTGTLGATRPRD